MSDRKKMFYIIAAFLGFYFIPFESSRVAEAVKEGFLMTQDYAKEHFLLSLLPAFFISGAISVFFSKNAVVQYLGAKTNKILSYGIASISGAILAVCS